VCGQERMSGARVDVTPVAVRHPLVDHSSHTVRTNDVESPLLRAQRRRHQRRQTPDELDIGDWLAVRDGFRTWVMANVA
jgi:hypothetical protein